MALRRPGATSGQGHLPAFGQAIGRTHSKVEFLLRNSSPR
jgi:hypothetical protein